MPGFYANSAGRMGPNVYRDPPAPRDAPECPQCGSTGITEDGDKFDWEVRCDECGYQISGGIDPQDYLEQQAERHEPAGDVW